MTTWTTTITGMRHKRSVAPNPSTVELTWRVKATDDQTGAELSWDPFTYGLTIIDDASMPKPGDKLTGYLAGTTSADWSAYFRCREINWQHLNDSFSIWEARATFTAKEAWCPIPYVYRTDSTRMRSVDLWHRDGPEVAMIESVIPRHPVANGDYVPVAEMGKPLKGEVPQQEITVSYIWNTGVPSADTGNGYPNLQAVIDGAEAYLNSRNQTAFLGFPKGTVRLMGVTVDPDQDEFVRVSYLFVYDYWGFMTQEPKLLPNGVYDKDVDANGYTYPKEVNFMHTTYSFAEFNDLLTTNEADYLIKGWVHHDQVTCDDPVSAASTSITVEPGKAQMDATSGVRLSTAP